MKRSDEPWRFTDQESKLFLEQSADMMVISELSTGKVIKANSAEREILGLEFWNFGTFLDLIHPEDRAELLGGLEELNAGKSRIDLCRCRTKDGSCKWIEWHGVPVPAENKIYAIGRDVTARKNAESKTQQLGCLVESSSDAIIGVDLNDCITSSNRAACELFGIAAKDAQGNSIQSLLSQTGARSFREIFAPGIEHELACKFPDGRVLEVSLMLCDVFDEMQAVVGYGVFVRDITIRKETASRVREFYSTVSHELRTPLTSIKGALGLIRGGIVEGNSAEAAELLEVASDSSDRLIRLINDILDIQKIEIGKMELIKTEVDPVELISMAIKETTQFAEQSSVSLSWDTKNDLPNVMVARDKVVQVITNLISNAVKVSGPGGSVQVGASRNDTQVRFSVLDSGSGIPPEQSHKLFGKFQQLRNHDGGQYAGTGLGLAICKSLVEQHGGSIGYENEIIGCRFWFDLPISAVDV